MLEGKELDFKIGQYGDASLDITPDGKVKLAVGVEVDLMQLVEQYAAKHGSKVLDLVVGALKKAFPSAP